MVLGSHTAEASESTPTSKLCSPCAQRSHRLGWKGERKGRKVRAETQTRNDRQNSGTPIRSLLPASHTHIYHLRFLLVSDSGTSSTTLFGVPLKATLEWPSLSHHHHLLSTLQALLTQKGNSVGAAVSLLVREDIISLGDFSSSD